MSVFLESTFPFSSYAFYSQTSSIPFLLAKSKPQGLRTGCQSVIEDRLPPNLLAQPVCFLHPTYPIPFSITRRGGDLKGLLSDLSLALRFDSVKLLTGIGICHVPLFCFLLCDMKRLH